ncbi:MAG: hypothetical protein HUK14_04845 [Muribaculaceae bacterium]|nr:hypothetical protein [Muribaculaceae bacterium]
MQQNVRDIIRQLAQPDGETVAMVCTVDAVDKTARTIDCTPLNEGAPLLGVNLQANQGSDFGVCLFPEVGSFVVVGFVADGAAGVMLSTDKIESAEIVIGETSAVMDADGCRIDTAKMSAHINKEDIIFNGGDLDGLVIIQKLTDKLNELKDTVNDLISKYNAHVHITTATVGASGTPGVLQPTTSTATAAKPFNKNDYENTKIKQ